MLVKKFTKWSSLLRLFFGHLTWLVGSSFLSQGPEPAPGSGDAESWPLGHQGLPVFFMCVLSVVLFLKKVLASYCHYIWRASFSHSLKLGLIATNSLSFSSSWNTFISPAFLRGNFTGFCSWLFSFFQHMKNNMIKQQQQKREIVSYCATHFWATRVSGEKSAGIWIIFLYRNLLFLTLLKISSCFQKVSHDVLVWISLGFSYLGFAQLLESVHLSLL